MILFTAVAYAVMSPLGVIAGVSAIPLVAYLIWWLGNWDEEEVTQIDVWENRERK